MKTLTNQNTLFIICPFCQLENYLRTKFGEDVFFITATAGVLNFSEAETTAIKDFIEREKISTICVVNDVACNFIDEAIANKKEFGLYCERELRLLLQNLDLIMESKHSWKEKRELLANANVTKQLEYLNSENIFKQKIQVSGINTRVLITNKNKINNTIKSS